MAKNRDAAAADPQLVIKELRRERNEALAREAATGEVLRVISSSPADLEPVFTAIVARAAELCEAEFSGVARLEGGLLRLVAVSNLSDREAQAFHGLFPREPTRGFVMGRAFIDRRPAHVEDVLSDPHYDLRAQQILQLETGYRTFLGVPILVRGEAIGVIGCGRREVRAFSAAQIELVRTFAEQAVIAIENARLIGETREALEQQTATAEVLQVINSSPGDLAPVFDAMLEKAATLCEAAYGVLWIYDGRCMTAAAVHGDAKTVAAVRKLGALEPRPGSLGYRLLHGESVVHITDAQDDQSYRSGSPARRALVDIAQAHTLLGVALRKDDAVLGLVTVYRQQVRPFSDKQIALLQNFAAQAVIAIENARLITETRERTRDLQEALEYQTATSDVLKVISRSTFDLQLVLDTLVETAARLFGATFTFIATRDGERYRPTALYSVSPEWDVLLRTQSFAPDRGTVLGRALIEARVVQVDDIVADAEHTNPEAVTLGKARTVVGAPLLREGEAIGVMVLARQHVEPFTERQIDLVRTFADQAVIAIENTRLITETREALERQTATAEVLQVINSSPGELGPVFEAMLEKAMRLCGAPLGHLMRYDGERFATVAQQGVPAAYAEFMSAPLSPTQTGGSLAALVRGERFVQVTDLKASEAYRSGNPARRALVDLAGGRTGIWVALHNDAALLGGLVLYRPEVRPFADREIALLQNFAAQAVIAMENARLINETRQRTVELQEALAYQTATGEVLRIVASSPDRLAPVFEAILERATALCGVGAANLYLHEDGAFRAAAALHPDPEMVADMIENPIRPGPGTAIYRAFSTRTPVHIADIADDGAYGAGNPFRVRMIERGVRAVLLVPLVRGDEAIGVVTIYRPVPEPYTEAQIELVRTFADQAVIAIENARLFGELRAARDAAEAAYKDLQTAQSRLLQAQKMAALGQLTAGIAHEIKNPLNFVNNFAGLSTELLDELKEALAEVDEDKREAIDETIEMLTGNLDKIAEHGRRADNIVKSMLEHSRGVSGEKRTVDLNALVDEALNLAFHGARAQDQSFNITLERNYAEALGTVELAPQEMTRVFLNLFGNGFYAAHKRAQANGLGAYRPTLRVATRDDGNAVEVTIRDNGTGIPADVRDKLFQPFFTTKPTGEGTGLGLSISYDIVTQQHGGTIAVASEEGAYTEFTIRLPRG